MPRNFSVRGRVHALANLPRHVGGLADRCRAPHAPQAPEFSSKHTNTRVGAHARARTRRRCRRPVGRSGMTRTPRRMADEHTHARGPSVFISWFAGTDKERCDADRGGLRRHHNGGIVLITAWPGRTLPIWPSLNSRTRLPREESRDNELTPGRRAREGARHLVPTIPSKARLREDQLSLDRERGALEKDITRPGPKPMAAKVTNSDL